MFQLSLEQLSLLIFIAGIQNNLYFDLGSVGFCNPVTNAWDRNQETLASSAAVLGMWSFGERCLFFFFFLLALL